MAHQTEPRHVGAGVDFALHEHVPRVFIELRHDADHGLFVGFGKQTGFRRRRQDAGAQGLRQNEDVAGLCAAVAVELFRVDVTRYGKAVFRLFVQDRVTARQHRPGLVYLIVAAPQDLPGHVLGKVPGDAHHVHAGLRRSAHGVDVGQGVGCRHLAEGVGVIHDGREEIHRLHEGQLVVYSVDARVVALIESHEKVGIALHGDAVQNFSENSRSEFGPSSCAACKGREFYLLCSHWRSPPFVP